MSGTGRAGKMNIVETIKLASNYLEGKGVPSPRLNAELLLAKALGCSRLDLYLRFDEVPLSEAMERFKSDLRLRAKRYPIQYITGSVEFYSLPFKIIEGVFIPRPETELLVEWAEESMDGMKDVRFVEFGVGSGIISGTLAKRNDSWRGVAVDISRDAVILARENIEALGVSERVSLILSDGFDSIRCDGGFDLLVANPPYIPGGAIPDLQPEVSGYEERSALDGGPDGLRFYPAIVNEGMRLLSKGGVAIVEIGQGEEKSVKEMFVEGGYSVVDVRKDYNGLERLVRGVK